MTCVCKGSRPPPRTTREILRNPEFRSGQFNTSFVESHPELTNYSIKRKPEELALAIAAAIAAHAGL
ncbi:2-oxoglutarate carboxylase small subunit [compost metagenome]